MIAPALPLMGKPLPHPTPPSKRGADFETIILIDLKVVLGCTAQYSSH